MIILGHMKKLSDFREKMYERDLKTILLLSQNKLEASTVIFSYKHIYNNLNIPLLPNIVAVISFISLLINRTEMWGIFIAKYDPKFDRRLLWKRSFTDNKIPKG